MDRPVVVIYQRENSSACDVKEKRVDSNRPLWVQLTCRDLRDAEASTDRCACVHITNPEDMLTNIPAVIARGELVRLGCFLPRCATGLDVEILRVPRFLSDAGCGLRRPNCKVRVVLAEHTNVLPAVRAFVAGITVVATGFSELAHHVDIREGQVWLCWVSGVDSFGWSGAEYFAEEHHQPSSSSSWSPSSSWWSSSSWTSSWQNWHQHSWQDDKWSEQW